MYRPYIVCHMVTSIDGKVTGEFLSRPECEAATEIYYEMNREYKAQGSGGFICGRVTMEGSFTGGWYPDLSEYNPVEKCLSLATTVKRFTSCTEEPSASKSIRLPV